MPRFSHDEAELNWSPSHTFRIRTDEADWTLTPETALWVPAGCPHRVSASVDDVIFPLRFPTVSLSLAGALGEPTLIRVDADLRRAMLRLVQAGLSPRFDRALEQRHVLASLPALVAPRLELPMPEDADLVEIATALRRDPATAPGLDRLAARLGLSERTLLRRFKRQTGMTVSTYRAQARLARSLTLLEAGLEVAEVASQVGYSGTSAFTAAFRRAFGHPPRTLRARADPPPDTTITRAAVELTSRCEHATRRRYALRFGADTRPTPSR